MIKRAEILTAIDIWAPSLRSGDLVAEAVLAAITCPETSWGLRWKASKSERAYKPGGAYFINHVPGLYDEYGDAAASSWSAWQILYVAAWEMGFRGDPWRLCDPTVSLEYVVKLLNARCFNEWKGAPTPELMKPADTIEEVGDMWNSGTFRDSRPPLPDYLPKIVPAYERALQYYRAA